LLQNKKEIAELRRLEAREKYGELNIFRLGKMFFYEKKRTDSYAAKRHKHWDER
jgi:hypothetical protein